MGGQMKYLAALLLSAAAGWTWAAAPASAPTAAEVTAAIQAMDAAMQKKDVDAALKTVAETAQIRLGVTTDKGPEVLPLGRKEYREVLNTTLADAEQYRIERKAALVTPLKDGKVLYTDFVSEIIRSRGKETRTLSQERFLLERLNGQVQITVLESSVLSSR
jgi:hypothetical protein